MAEAIAMKANTEEEKVTLRAVLARGNQTWSECPCGWFYSGPRCPDKSCKKWKQAGGTKTIKLYAHVDDEGEYEEGEKLGLEGDALREFVSWGYELAFDAKVDMETGKVTLLMVDGRKIEPES